jgi:rubrerythrin
MTGRLLIAAQTQVDVSTPVGVLNYALTLEHLEAAFYREGLRRFGEADFTDAGYAPVVRKYLTAIQDHEAEHVDTLMQVIGDLKGEPVAAGQYDFGYADVAGFLGVAQTLENTGVSAYEGAAQYLIEEDQLLTAALTIHGVEARHAAYLNGLNGVSPFPAATDPPLAPDDVLAAASQFIVTAATPGAAATPTG